MSIARRRPTRSSVVRCSDTSGGISVRAVSVAMWRVSPSRVLCAAPGSPGLTRVRTDGISTAFRSPLSLRHGGLSLTVTMVESVRWRRLRWRLRGAWQWPVFAVLTVLDAMLVAWLPFQGEGGDIWGAVLLVGFVNLLAVALVAPFLGMAVRRRRPDLPRVVARDYAGT